MTRTDTYMSPSDIDFARRLKEEGSRLGFDRLGVAPAVAPPSFAHYQDWLERGFEAGMAYMRSREDARAHPDSVFPGVRSIVVGAVLYGEHNPEDDNPRHGRIARYARGADYHEVLWHKLEQLLAWLQRERPGLQGRAVADTAPLLERDFARLAGLGWTGKNTMLINRAIGSFTVLGAILVDQELPFDTPHVANHCGTCTRCLDACPTAAFDGEYRLDANKCLSYWTIEHRGAIPIDIAERLDGWAFGCDICQDVCPWNRKAPEGRNLELAARREWVGPDLIEWLEMDAGEFSKRIKSTAISRAKRRGLIRNAALILGSRGVLEARPALERLREDEDEGVRDAVRWALARLDEKQRLTNDNATPP